MKSLNLKLLLELIDKVTAPVQRMRQKFVTAMTTMKTLGVGGLAKALQFQLHYGLLLLEERLKKVGETLKKTGKQMSEMGKFFTTRLTLPIAGFGAFAVRSAGNIEELKDRFKTLTGSADEAARMLATLREIKSPFELQELGDAASLLLSAGYSVDKTTDRLRFLGDVAAGSKNSVSDLVGMYISLRKSGKASDDDLAGMMRQNIPIVKMLSSQLGVSEKQVFKLAAAGKISFAQVKKALQDSTKEGGLFFNKMEEKTKSIFGVFGQLKKEINDSLAGIGEEIFTDLDIGGKIRAITSFIRSLADGFMKLPKPMKNAIVWTGLVIAAIGPLIFTLGQLVMGVGLVALGFGHLAPLLILLGKGFMALATAILTTPLGWLLLAVAGIIAIGLLLIKHWDAVARFFNGMWQSVKDTFSGAADYIMEKLEPLLSMLDGLREKWTAFKDFAANNPVTLGIKQLVGAEDADGGAAETSPALAAAADPVGARNNVKVDTGGTLDIRIQSDGTPTVEKSKANDQGMSYRVDTGLMNGGY